MTQTFIIVGVHRTHREVVVWAGKGGFVPLAREKVGPPCVAKEISGGVAEELMKHLTKRLTTTKYEFFLVPLSLALVEREPVSEAGLILPHLH